MKILVVDDTLTERMILSAVLKKLGHEVVTGEDGREAVELYAEHQPDLLLMDVMMPVMDGHQAAREIRAHQALAEDWVPIIFLSGRSEARDIQQGIEAGGDDYLTKPVDQTVLAAKMKAMQRIAAMRGRLLEVSRELAWVNGELKALAERDGLTGLANRRFLDRHLEDEVARCARAQLPLSVVMIDVDHFKAFNDLHGHLAGDDCLKQIAQALAGVPRRPGDLAARYGGEEFCMVLPNTTAAGAVAVAERMRVLVSSQVIPDLHTDSPVTASFGVANAIPDNSNFDPAGLLRSADKALYHAKQAGRNRVRVFLSSDPAGTDTA